MIGIDIQTSAIKLVQLKRARQTYRVLNMVEMSLTGMHPDEDKPAFWTAVTSALTNTVNAYGLRGMAVATAIPASLVRMLTVKLPPTLPDDAIQTYVLAEIDKELPGMQDALSIDYHVIKQTAGEKREVLCAIAREEHLSQYVNSINDAGLKVKIVDIDDHAEKRAATLDIALRKRLQHYSIACGLAMLDVPGW
jgi:type IV pilus assembly protein PilM